MGSVWLLTREGEVEIAKRMENGQLEFEPHCSIACVQLTLQLIEKLSKRCIRLKELIGEPPEGVEIIEDRAEKLYRLAADVKKLDQERRKIEERLRGIQPMKDSYRKQLQTRLSNVKKMTHDTMVEMGFIKRVIDVMSSRIKLLQYRAMSAEDMRSRIVRRTKADGIGKLEKDLRTLRRTKDKRTSTEY